MMSTTTTEKNPRDEDAVELPMYPALYKWVHLSNRRVNTQYTMKRANAVPMETVCDSGVSVQVVKVVPAPNNLHKRPSVSSVSTNGVVCTDSDSDIIEVTIKSKTYDTKSIVDLTNGSNEDSTNTTKKLKRDGSMLPEKVDAPPAGLSTTTSTSITTRGMKKERDAAAGPLPFEEIKRSNSLFFSYDPRGVRKGIPLPEGHCKYCRCPTLYCANIVLAKVCVDHMNFLIYRNPAKPIEDKTQKGMFRQFRICYTEAVIAAMRTNGIDFKEGFRLTCTVRLP